MDYVYEGGILDRLDKVLSELPKGINIKLKIKDEWTLEIDDLNDKQGEADPNI